MLRKLSIFQENARAMLNHGIVQACTRLVPCPKDELTVVRLKDRWWQPPPFSPAQFCLHARHSWLCASSSTSPSWVAPATRSSVRAYSPKL